MGWSLKTVLFLAISMLVQPVQPDGAKGRGASQPKPGGGLDNHTQQTIRLTASFTLRLWKTF